MSYKSVAEERPDRYKVSVAEYVQYQSQGFLVARGLVSPDEVESLVQHGMDILHGRVQVPGPGISESAVYLPDSRAEAATTSLKEEPGG